MPKQSSRRQKAFCDERKPHALDVFCQNTATSRVKIGSKPYKKMCGTHKNAAVKKHGKKAVVKSL